MTYRQLKVEEWEQLRPQFDARHVPMPNPTLATIYAAFDDDQTMQAFIVCQFKLHTEPVVSFNPMVLPGLIKCAEKSLIGMGFSGVESFIGATSPRVVELARALGFEQSETVLVRRIGTLKMSQRGTIQ